MFIQSINMAQPTNNARNFKMHSNPSYSTGVAQTPSAPVQNVAFKGFFGKLVGGGLGALGGAFLGAAMLAAAPAAGLLVALGSYTATVGGVAAAGSKIGDKLGDSID